MGVRRILAMAVAITGAVAITVASTPTTASGPSAPPSADAENAWVARGVANDDREVWEVYMPDSGRGLFFYQGSYRTWDPQTLTWSASRTLARDVTDLTVKGNRLGDVCALWSGTFGVGAACRSRQGSAWDKRNLARVRGSRIITATVSASGSRAMLAWWEPVAGGGTPRLMTARYSFATGAWSAPQRVPISARRGAVGAVELQAYGARFVLLCVHTRRAGQATVPVSTYQRIWQRASGWSPASEVRLAMPGGQPAPVVLMQAAGDGASVAGAFLPAAAWTPPYTPYDWWIARLDVRARFASPVPAGVETQEPQLAVSGTSTFVLGEDAQGALQLSLVRGGRSYQVRYPSPTRAGASITLRDHQIVPQTMVGGEEGFSLFAEYNAYISDDDGQDVQTPYAATGFYDAMTDRVTTSELSRIGTTSTYDGLFASLAGWGHAAVVAYSTQDSVEAAVRQPPN